MSNFKNLFVVIDPTSKKQPALERAATIAKMSKGKITAFSAIHKPIDQMGAARSRKSGKHAELDAWEAKVKEMVAPYKESGIKVTSDTYWTADWYAAVSRAALRNEADLVVKSTLRYGKLKRLLHSTSDYTIMRHSPAPVLLVRERKSFSGKVILAALDLQSTNVGHMALNNAVLKHALRLAEFTDLPLHVVCATTGKPDFNHLLVGAEPQEGGVIATLAKAFGVEEKNFHVVRGDARNVILKKAEELKADTVVLGVSANSAIKDVLVGATVRKVLDKLPCDVLAVR